MPVKNQHFTGKCEDYTYDGMGVVRYGTFCVFVKDMAFGDEGEIVITALRKDYAYGRLLKLEKAGEGRCEPLCPLSRQCGGCQLQHLTYAEQLRFKEELVRSNIIRIGGIDTPVSPIIGAEEPFYYRNKCQLPVGTDRNGNTVMGFYRFNSHDIIPFEKCYLQSERANNLTAEIRKMIEEYDLSSEIRHLMIRDMKTTGEMMVVFVTWKEKLPELQLLTDRILKAAPEVISIIQNINPDQTNVVLGKKEKLLYGSENIQDELLGLKFNISSHSFYQVNSAQTGVLYSKAIELAELKGDETVIDMYCGVGTIGMIASRKAGKVIGVEIVEAAVQDAVKNAELNGIDNIDFICADARKASVDLVKQNVKADVIFVDPPRKGCDTVTLDSLVTINPDRIVYVSCNPATLARDLKYLAERGYQTVTIQPVDQFPQTYHVETVCLLKRWKTEREINRLENNMTENNGQRVAQRNDWKTEPMPQQHETFVLHRSFSDEEMAVLSRGNIPQAMEDKWFWYMEGSTLWAHRSWTGYCIYRIEFKEDDNHIVTVNRDPQQYRCTSIEEDIESLNRLLDWWTQTPYDHYNQWLSEISNSLDKADKT